jgi:predicted phage tail protein
VLRQIVLHGSLEKATGESTISLDVDQQNQLFAALRARSTKCDMALRKYNEVSMWTTDADGTGDCLIQGMGFGNAQQVHICPHTEGAYIPGASELVVYVIIAAVIVIGAVAISLLSHMQTNSNGAGGGKSTMFNGITNSTDQGGAIPIIYGKRVLVGSTIIGADESYVNLL